MSDGVIGQIGGLLDAIIADPGARDAAKLELLKLDGSPDLDCLRAQLVDAPAEPRPADVWTGRARPTFLYVMYALLLWAIPLGLVAAIRPDMARNIAAGMSAYLNAIPEPLYALFGTGYLGYTVAREWGKAKAG